MCYQILIKKYDFNVYKTFFNGKNEMNSLKFENEMIFEIFNHQKLKNNLVKFSINSQKYKKLIRKIYSLFYFIFVAIFGYIYFLWMTNIACIKINLFLLVKSHQKEKSII